MIKGKLDYDIYEYTATYEGCIYVDKGEVPTEVDIKACLKDEPNEMIDDMEISDIHL